MSTSEAASRDALGGGDGCQRRPETGEAVEGWVEDRPEMGTMGSRRGEGRTSRSQGSRPRRRAPRKNLQEREDDVILQLPAAIMI